MGAITKINPKIKSPHCSIKTAWSWFTNSKCLLLSQYTEWSHPMFFWWVHNIYQRENMDPHLYSLYHILIKLTWLFIKITHWSLSGSEVVVILEVEVEVLLEEEVVLTEGLFPSFFLFLWVEDLGVVTEWSPSL